MNPTRIQFKPINRPIPANGTIMEPTVSVKLFARALWKLGSPEFEPWDADLEKRQLGLQRAMGRSAPEWYPRAHRRAFEPGGPLCIFCDQRTKNAHPYIYIYPPPCLQGTQGVFNSMPNSASLLRRRGRRSSSLGASTPHNKSTGILCCSCFLFLFRILFQTTISEPKGPKRPPKGSPKIAKSRKCLEKVGGEFGPRKGA